MKKIRLKSALAAVTLTLGIQITNAQNNLRVGTATPAASIKFNVSSFIKGFLLKG